MINTGLMGFGKVGKAVLLELIKQGDVSLSIVCSSTGYVVVENDQVYRELIDLANSGEKLSKHSRFVDEKFNPELLTEHGVELVFIAIPPNYFTGEPNRTIYYSLLDHDISIITADKTVLALEYSEVMNYAWEKKLYIGYRATVGAGTPIIDIVKGLRGRRIERIRAILNATTNYILSLIEKGFEYSEAVERAIREKYTEPDPSIDTYGWDSAAKLSIILSILGYNVSVKNIVRKPLDGVFSSRIYREISKGYRYKYLAEAYIDERKYMVHPVKLSVNDPLYDVSSNLNSIIFYLEDNMIKLTGPTGPVWRTAKTMITDLFEYIDFRRRYRGD